jgi:hypothetical protein
LYKTDLHISIYEKVDKLITTLIGAIASPQLDNSIDFHFVTTILEEMVKAGYQYSQELVKAINDDETALKVHDGTLSKKLDKDLEIIWVQFEKWRLERAEKNPDNKQMLAQKKITRAQWQEEAFMIRMQKVAKRRRNMLKQQMLEDKASRIKGK